MHSTVWNGPYMSAYKYSYGCVGMYIGLKGSNCDEGVTAWQKGHVLANLRHSYSFWVTKKIHVSCV